jgi:hypothetical protein
MVRMRCTSSSLACIPSVYIDGTSTTNGGLGTKCDDLGIIRWESPGVGDRRAGSFEWPSKRVEFDDAASSSGVSFCWHRCSWSLASEVSLACAVCDRDGSRGYWPLDAGDGLALGGISSDGFRTRAGPAAWRQSMDSRRPFSQGSWPSH